MFLFKELMPRGEEYRSFKKYIPILQCCKSKDFEVLEFLT